MSDNQKYLANTPGDVPVPLDQSAPDYMQNSVNTLKAMKNGPDDSMNQSAGLKNEADSSYLGVPQHLAGGDGQLGQAEWEGDGSYAAGLASSTKDET